MKPQDYNHTGKHYYHRKAILEYYDSSDKLLRREEFEIKSENRFLYHGLELDELYVSYWEDYEIIIYEIFFIKLIDGQYQYVPTQTSIPIPQTKIDEEFVKKLYGLNIIQIPNYLAYQLKKYQNRKTVLKRWRKLILENTDLANSLHGRFRVDVQEIALDWINGRLRKSNLREYRPSKDIPFNDLFKSSDLLESVLTALEKQEYIKHNLFNGRYDWLKGGQDLAILGETLQIRHYFSEWVDYSIRHNALTKFFNVGAKVGFGKRTFQKSTIEEVYNQKKGQYTFIRPARL